MHGDSFEPGSTATGPTATGPAATGPTATGPTATGPAAENNPTKASKGKARVKQVIEVKGAEKTGQAKSSGGSSGGTGSSGGQRVVEMGRVEITRRLQQVLKELHLPTMRACYEEAARSAAREALPYEQFLLEVLEREQEVRHNNRIERLLKESHLPLEKTLESFEMGRLPARVRQQVGHLVEGSFLSRKENLLAFGNPGSGKTHLLCGISQELIRRGHKVLYTSCALLVQEMLVAKRDLVMPRVLRRLGQYEALLIDDLGYVQQSREEMEVLFMLLAERYERGSVLITSNLPFSKWESIFKDPMTTAAAVDRLVHHSIILELNIPSYRMEKAKQAKKALAPGLEERSGLEEGTGVEQECTTPERMAKP